MDAAGDLYIADTYAQQVLMYSVETHSDETYLGIYSVKTVLASTTSIVAGGFNFPGNIAVDSAGNLYVADTNNWLIRRVEPLAQDRVQ
jgi:sugar lactone lactonase YvrE